MFSESQNALQLARKLVIVPALKIRGGRGYRPALALTFGMIVSCSVEVDRSDFTESVKTRAFMPRTVFKAIVTVRKPVTAFEPTIVNNGAGTGSGLT